jgi:DNA-binding IclR family transcriptional regulator
MPEDRYRAPALDKGLDILELLCAQPAAMTRGEIVKALGRNPSEIYRMLERLVARRYVSRSAEGDRYAPSLKLFMLAQHYPPLKRLVAQAVPLMEEFSKRTEQSCHLGLYEKGNIVVVAQTSSPGKLSLSVRLGSHVSLIDTGSGHVVLAFQTEARRNEMLAEHEPLEGEVPIPRERLAAILKRSRDQGYWEAESRHALGVTDVSAPVTGQDGYAFAALTCPYVTRIDRHVSAGIEATRELLLEVARKL